MTTEITTEIIKRTGPTVRIKFGPGYATSVIGRTMAKVTNTGNGYIAKFPSHSSTEQDHYVCMDYVEAHALWLALGEFFREGA
jgi:hypothetical protein